jgi:hypothetical protein
MRLYLAPVRRPRRLSAALRARLGLRDMHPKKRRERAR